MTKKIESVRKKDPFLICMLGIFLFCIFLGCMLLGTEKKKADDNFFDAYADDVDFCAWNAESIAAHNCNKGLKSRTLSSEISNTEALSTEEYSGFVMQYGASVRLNKVTGLRFKADIPDTLAKKVAESEEKSFGFVIAPAYYFEKAMGIDDQAGTAFDYVNDLAYLTEAYGARPALKMTCEPVEENGKLIIQASVANILYNNTNLTYTAAAYVKTERNTGEASYIYAAYSQTDCFGIARSVSYVATAALNDEKANYSEENRSVLRKFVTRGIDLAAMLTETESALYSERNIELTLENLSSSLAVGDSLTLSPLVTVAYPQAEQSEKRKILFPLYWKSSAPEIVSVNPSGEVTVHGEGSVEISAYVGEIKGSWMITGEVFSLYDCCVVNESGYDLLEFSEDSQKIRKGDYFTTTLSVKDYASYGELSFWIDGTLYTTENGALNFSRVISESTSFKIEKLSSSLDYFDISGSSLIVGNSTIDKIDLPVKLILPMFSEDGKALTAIGGNGFSGTNAAQRCTKLIELTVPESYTSFPAKTFQYCSALETIYLNNTNLSEVSLSPNWSGCNKLKKIYIPTGTLEAYSKNSFWKTKASCLEERDF